MTQNEFKVGDFVRIVKDPSYDLEDTWVEKGDIGVVAGLEDRDVLCVDFHPSTQERIYPHFCDLIERVDRRTAFLTELQALLRKYDAKIECWQSDFESVAMALNLGDDTVEYDSGDKSNFISVTADNIMDFDKD